MSVFFVSVSPSATAASIFAASPYFAIASCHFPDFGGRDTRCVSPETDDGACGMVETRCGSEGHLEEFVALFLECARGFHLITVETHHMDDLRQSVVVSEAVDSRKATKTRVPYHLLETHLSSFDEESHLRFEQRSGSRNMSTPPPQKKSQVITIAAGGMGGCLDALITMPLDTVKTYVQVNKGDAPDASLIVDNTEECPLSLAADVKGMASGARSILQNKGVAGFYFGLPAMIAQVLTVALLHVRASSI